MIELFLRGGVLFMLPLFLASITVVAITIERFLRYKQAEIDYDDFVDEVRGALGTGIGEAREVTGAVPGPVARIWDEGLKSARQPVPIIRERMEVAAMREVSRLERFLPQLGVIAQVAPLVGILGTVWGMIVSFQGVEGGLAIGAGIHGEQLAGGIWKALITTGAGLLVAILALVADHYLRHRVERFLEAIERSVPDVVFALVDVSRKGSSKQTRRAPVDDPMTESTVA
ncbi:MAG: MotA/TolQ/ExbB proton channel family protein [Planctomycetota bacterium]